MGEYLHIIVQKHDGYWSARCLDFTLYSVGNTAEEAKEKLAIEIDDFLYEAIEGQDKEFAVQLLLRRAPLRDWVIFHVVSLLQHCRVFSKWIGETFKQSVPHGPYHHA